MEQNIFTSPSDVRTLTMCYGNYLEGNLNYVVYGDLAVSISQEKQNNFRATLRLFLQFMLSNKNEGEKAVKH